MAKEFEDNGDLKMSTLYYETAIGILDDDVRKREGSELFTSGRNRREAAE
jgi:hypothetical protein